MWLGEGGRGDNFRIYLAESVTFGVSISGVANAGVGKGQIHGRQHQQCLIVTQGLFQFWWCFAKHRRVPVREDFCRDWSTTSRYRTIHDINTDDNFKNFVMACVGSGSS